MSDFNALLDAPLESHERPKPIPVGSYVATLGAFKFDESKQKKTPFVQYPVTLVQAMPDVDEEALREALNGKPLNEYNLRPMDYYLTGDAAWRLRQLLEEHVKVEAGLPTREAIQAAVGAQVVVVIEHTPNTRDPKAPPYVNIKETAALPTD